MTVVAARLDDQVVDSDGRSVVLVGQDVSVISALATAALRLAEDPITANDLGRRLADLFGEPAHGSVAEATGIVVASLLARGLLAEVTAG